MTNARMADGQIVIEAGLRLDHRAPAAAGYWQAFSRKLRWPLGPERKAIDFIQSNLDSSHAISALSNAGEFLGVAGFKTPRGAFVGGDFTALAKVYGFLGAVWRGALIAVLERQCEPSTLLMDGIFVHPEARGMGIGSRLLVEIESHAAACGLRRVRLDVIDTNRRARALYERHGFKPTAEKSIGMLKHVFGFSTATTMSKDSAA